MPDSVPHNASAADRLQACFDSNVPNRRCSSHKALSQVNPKLLIKIAQYVQSANIT